MSVTPARQLWASTLPGETASDEAVSPDGTRLFVTGYLGTQGKFETVAYSAATGAQLWATAYLPASSSHGGPAAITVGPDGGTVYVTGDTSSALGQGAATFAYDAGTGKQLWVSRYHTKGAYLGAPAVSPDGATVYVAGTGRLSGRQSQFAVIAYAAATGQQRWLRYYSTVPGFAASAAVSPDGTTVYVTGDSVGSVLTVAYQATGNLEWATLYKNPYAGGAAGSQIVAGPGGNAVYVVGTASNKSGHSDIATFAYRAATGKCFWMDRYNARAGPFAGAIGVTPDGRTVVVTGSPNEGRTGGYAIAAYNASTGGQGGRRLPKMRQRCPPGRSSTRTGTRWSSSAPSTSRPGRSLTAPCCGRPDTPRPRSIRQRSRSVATGPACSYPARGATVA